MCNAKRVAMNGVKRNTLAGGGVDSISQLTIEKAGVVCYDKRIDGGEKMNNSQNKNLLTEGSIWKKTDGICVPAFSGKPVPAAVQYSRFSDRGKLSGK